MAAERLPVVLSLCTFNRFSTEAAARMVEMCLLSCARLRILRPMRLHVGTSAFHFIKYSGRIRLESFISALESF